MGNQDGTGFNRAEAQQAIEKASAIRRHGEGASENLSVIKNRIVLRDLLLPYYVVQFLPLILTGYMLANWPGETHLKASYVFPTIFLYIVAKVFEVRFVCVSFFLLLSLT
jgi:hypothetical protein